MADDPREPQGHFADEPSPGEALRAARIEQKLDTKEVAATLNVDPWMLDALEHDEYGALGAPVFAKGHLRKYASLLGLDVDHLMVAYYQRAGTRDAPPLVAESMLRVESTPGPRLAWLAPAAGVLVLAVLALGVFFYLQPDGGTEPARAAAASAPVVTTSSGRSTALRLPGAPDTATSGDAGQAEPTPAAVSQSAPATSPPPQVTTPVEPEASGEAVTAVIDEPEPPAPEPEPEPQVEQRVASVAAAPADAGSVTVTLRFVGESWVEVYDRDRTKLLYGLGEAGTTRSLNGTAPLNVFLGKAGDVEVEVNGRDYRIPRISRLGTARFDVDAP